MAAVAAAIQTIVVIVAALFAKRQVDEAKQLREAQSRPFVIIDFDVLRVRRFIYLVITNLGQTLARNVRFTFEPPLSSSIDEKHDTLKKARLLTEGIPTLAPGREIPILFDSFLERGDERPDAYEVQVSYEGEKGQEYTDTVLLDLGIYRNLIYIDRKDIHHVHEQLKDIAKTLKRWSAGFDGLHVRTDADLERAREEQERRMEEPERQAWNEASAPFGPPGGG